MSLQLLLLVGLGGFLGTILRVGAGSWLGKYTAGGFPLGTLVINLAGSLAIGYIYGYFEKEGIASTQWKLILTAGFCGGFTTFSAFSIENLQMLRDGQYLLAIFYIFISVLLGLLLTYAGLSWAKS